MLVLLGQIVIAGKYPLIVIHIQINVPLVKLYLLVLLEQMVIEVNTVTAIHPNKRTVDFVLYYVYWDTLPYIFQ